MVKLTWNIELAIRWKLFLVFTHSSYLNQVGLKNILSFFVFIWIKLMNVLESKGIFANGIIFVSIKVQVLLEIRSLSYTYLSILWVTWIPKTYQFFCEPIHDWFVIVLKLILFSMFWVSKLLRKACFTWVHENNVLYLIPLIWFIFIFRYI